MRKSLWIILAVMFVGVGAAQADTFTYTYNAGDFSWTTNPITGVTGETTVLAADLASTSNTGLVAGCTTTSVVLDSGGVGSQATFFGFGGGCGIGSFTNDDMFALSDYTTPGVYSFFGTLTVTAVTAPEPSSLALIPFGLGALLLMRKRAGQARPSAI